MGDVTIIKCKGRYCKNEIHIKEDPNTPHSDYLRRVLNDNNWVILDDRALKDFHCPSCHAFNILEEIDKQKRDLELRYAETAGRYELLLEITPRIKEVL
jgi:hypothetical protein